MDTQVAKINPNEKIGSEVQHAKDLFTHFAGDIERSLPKHISKDSLLSAVINSCRKNPKLLTCTRASMISSLITCASTGLIPDDPKQECHLIPYWNSKRSCNEVQWQAGYRGLIKLSRQSGEIAFIDAFAVYEGDFFEYNLGTDPYIKHTPCPPSERGNVVYAYAVATYKDQSLPKQFEVMSVEEIDVIKDRSLKKVKYPQYSPWSTDYTEMTRKTPIRRLAKRLPMSSELALAVELDNKVAGGDEQPFADIVHSMIEAQLDKRSHTEKLEDAIDPEGKQADTQTQSEDDEKKELIEAIEKLERDGRFSASDITGNRRSFCNSAILPEATVDRLASYRHSLANISGIVLPETATQESDPVPEKEAGPTKEATRAELIIKATQVSSYMKSELEKMTDEQIENIIKENEQTAS